MRIKHKRTDTGFASSQFSTLFRFSFCPKKDGRKPDDRSANLQERTRQGKDRTAQFPSITDSDLKHGRGAEGCNNIEGVPFPYRPARPERVGHYAISVYQLTDNGGAASA